MSVLIQIVDACPICGGHADPLVKVKFKSIVGIIEDYEQLVDCCDHCGFSFTRNPFSTDVLNNRYSSHSKFEFDSKDYFLSDSESYKKRSARQMSYINMFINDYSSVLDIGASSGYNLGLYKGSGKMCQGIEPSENNCKNANINYGLNMYCGTFDDFYPQSKDKFDLIILSHTLEHIVNPMDFIRKCSDINTNYIYIEVPTFDYKIVDEPYGMFAEEHVNYFTLEGLLSLMTKAGYSLVDAHFVMGFNEHLPAGWPAISSIWSRGTANNKIIPIQNTRQLIQNYVERSELEYDRISRIIDDIPEESKLAIWGTGHHASHLLANTSLPSKKIVKFYDSDKKKHSQKMQRVSIVPFDPADIINGEIDVVLIASYTAQVAILRQLQPYTKSCNVITLYDL